MKFANLLVSLCDVGADFMGETGRLLAHLGVPKTSQV